MRLILKMLSRSDVYFKLYKHACDDKDFDLAFGFLEKGLCESPNDYNFLIELMKCRVKTSTPPHISVVIKDAENAFLADPTQLEPYTFILPILVQNNLPEAEEWVERALIAFPENTEILNLAGVFNMNKNIKKSRKYFQMCIAQDPLNHIHHYNCGSTYVQDLEFLHDSDDKSIWHFKTALENKPDWIIAKQALAGAYIKHSRFKEALEIDGEGDPKIEALQIEARWRSCTTLNVDYDELISRIINDKGLLGSVLKNQTGYFEALLDYERAEKAYRHVYEFRDDYFGANTFMWKDASLGIGQFLCKIGKWDEGLPIMAESFQSKNKRDFPEWDGCSTVDHLVILNQQLGNGDQMFFSRYVPYAASKAVKTTLVVNQNVLHMYQNMKDINLITSECKGDAWVECSHLIKFFGTVPMYDFIPTPPRNAKSGKAILHLKSSKHNPLLNYRRDVPFEFVKNVLECEKWKWLCVAPQDETHFNLIDISETIDKGPDSFKDTMKLLTEVDFVITCDTFMAHLAGLMKCPCILILSTLCEYRWGCEKYSYQWYPTMTIIRQKEWGTWNPLSLTDVETHLAKLGPDGHMTPCEGR